MTNTIYSDLFVELKKNNFIDTEDRIVADRYVKNGLRGLEV